MLEKLSNPFSLSVIFSLLQDPPKRGKSSSAFCRLPEELLLKILDSLPRKALFCCRLTCRKLYRISCDRGLRQPDQKALFERLLQANPKKTGWWKRGFFNAFAKGEEAPFKRIAARGTALNLAAGRTSELELDSLERLNFLKKHFKNLSRLNLSGCFHLSDKDLARLPKTLLELSFAWSRNCSDQALGSLPRKLKLLKISPCYGLRGEALRHLPATVEELHLVDCYQITDRSFKKLPEGLKRLSLVSSGSIRGAGLKHLPKSLERLELKFCPFSGLITFKELPESLDNLILT